MKLNLSARLWSWTGRILPLTALLLVILLVTVDAREWLDYLLIAIATTFGTIAFFWWWWVVDAIRNLNKFFTESYDRFGEIQGHLREIKKDVHEVKASHETQLKALRKKSRK
jgi:hypothetical protein